MLTFEAETHTYKWHGKVVPSVSQILKTIGITRDYERVDPFYRQRGTYVHQAVEFHVKRTLDEETLDQENVLPYVKGYQQFEEKRPYVCLKTEVPLYSEEFGFAGTIDHICTLPKEFEGTGIADLKVTESSDKAADLQLCAYAILYHANHGTWPAFRMVLELHGDRTAKPIFYKTPTRIWNAVMELFKWKTTRRKKE